MPTHPTVNDRSIDPEPTEDEERSRRGRRPRLAVTCGSADGASLRVRVVGGELEVTSKEGSLVHGQIASWDKVGVITGAKRTGRDGRAETTFRYWLLEPGGNEERIHLGPLEVVGRFTIAEQKNGRAASEAFKGLAVEEA